MYIKAIRVAPIVANKEQFEKVFLFLYSLIKYQFTKDSINPVAGMTILNAQ